MTTEACGGGTPDLGYFKEVYVFIGSFGVGNKVGGARVVHEVGPRARGGWGAPPPSWTARDSSGPTLLLRGLLLVHKKSSKIGTTLDSVWYSFSVKLKNKEKTETDTRL